MPNTEVNKKSRRVAVTGLGVISALGFNLTHNREALFNQKSGLDKLSFIDSVYKKNLLVGEVKLSTSELHKKLKLPPESNHTRTALLGIWAAKEAVYNAGIQNLQDSRTGLISATTVGGMDKTEMYYPNFDKSTDAQNYLQSHHGGDSSHKIAQALGLQGLVTTSSTACSSAANAIMLGARLINAGKLDRIIVGGTDALSKFTINGFKSLLILSDEPCKPFDKDRTGLNLGEAAAYLVLEAEHLAQTQQKKVWAFLTGYANANDAYHQTASSADGAGAHLAMRGALSRAQLQPEQIDYINAHGTATPNNDLSESKAMLKLFNNKIPDFTSTKAYTGHTLATAGALESIFSIVSIKENKIFKNLNFNQPIPETGLVPVTTLKSKKIDHVLTNSFGFGGNCTSLVFSRV